MKTLIIILPILLLPGFLFKGHAQVRQDSTQNESYASCGLHILASSALSAFTQQYTFIRENSKKQRYGLGVVLPFKPMNDTCQDRIRWGILTHYHFPLSGINIRNKRYLKFTLLYMRGKFLYEAIPGVGPCSYRSPFDVNNSLVFTAGIDQLVKMGKKTELSLGFNAGGRYNHSSLGKGRWFPNLSLVFALNYKLSKS